MTNIHSNIFSIRPILPFLSLGGGVPSCLRAYQSATGLTHTNRQPYTLNIQSYQLT